jgi:hypothetical protein
VQTPTELCHEDRSVGVTATPIHGRILGHPPSWSGMPSFNMVTVKIDQKVGSH